MRYLANLQDEEWRNIPGYDGTYQCTRTGLVRSNFPGKLKCVLVQSNSDGYRQVGLRQKSKRVHRLIATTWIPPIDGKNLVNHVDGNRSNSHTDNLEWCTAKENSLHAVRTKLFVPGVTYGINHGKHRAVRQYTLLGELVKEWPFIRDAAISLSTSENQVCRVCSQKKGSSSGYQWRYADEGVENTGAGGQRKRTKNLVELLF